jgi:hypothetical protein
MRERRIVRLLLTARGSETLRWENAFQPLRDGADVAHLPAGHPFDLTTDVRYGIVGEPVPDAEAGPVAEGPLAQVPDEARRQVLAVLGPPFRVFQDDVQRELKINHEQKPKLDERLRETIQDGMQFFPKLDRLQPEERAREIPIYRQKAHERLAAFLKATLTVEQLRRLRQLELQEGGAFALGQPDVMADLAVTDEQRMRFQTLVQEMQRTLEPVIQTAQAGGDPAAIQPKVMTIRQEYAARIESILTAHQKDRWREMLGAPFDPGD